MRDEAQIKQRGVQSLMNLLAAGQTGLSIAYDMPTLYGYDVGLEGFRAIAPASCANLHFIKMRALFGLQLPCN